MRRQTFLAKPGTIQPSWKIMDAADVPLGRLAAEVAIVLMGKHKPEYTPHVISGDKVIITNATKVGLSGRKAEQKQYFRHTGYMGHEKYTPFSKMIATHPERVIEKAVHGMLPKSALARQVLRLKLRVYADANHPHVAQKPTALTFNSKSE